MTTTNPDTSRLVGDIGGTHARFAVATAAGELRAVRMVETREYASLQLALNGYLGTLGHAPPRRACLAVAAPVVGDHIAFTNCEWRFSISQLQTAMHFDALAVINDFAAIAHALPALHGNDLLQIGGETRDAAAPQVIIGPGTGCGVAIVVPDGDGSRVISTQGGHASIGAANAEELWLLGDLLRHDAPVSREDLLSGRGLEAIYHSVCRRHGANAASLSASQISDRALIGEDAHCCEALQLFCAFLGTAAGDQALASGALGGVFLAGGIVPRLAEFLRASQFRYRFENHPPMQDYLRPIPVYLIMHANPGLLGAARAWDSAPLAVQLSHPTAIHSQP